MRRIGRMVWGMAGMLLFFWPVSHTFPDPDSVSRAIIHPVSIEDVCLKVVQDSTLYTQGWDTLIQPAFWRKAMQIGPDSCIINIAKTREVVGIVATSFIRAKSNRQKKRYEDSIRTEYNLRQRDEIYFTTGRNHFYKFESLLHSIDKAVDIFMANQTDPWYAQAILLIESPGRLQFSTDGAYGAFQLMEGVAREMGLKVNKEEDEREHFERSAEAAARFLRTVCIPETRNLCNRYNLKYRENDLWFRLLVMHVYHAGARNVNRVLKKIRPKSGGLELITTMWQTKSRRFGNASQNYSQIALASLLELDEVLKTEGIICPEERMMFP